MSTQLPVVLLSCPNLPYFLGTFDTINFNRWWRSNALPDDIVDIKKGFHIYGRTHLAIAKRRDGRWAIYRSKNYGIDWDRVWLAAEGEAIYDLVLITYGWAIMNTSKGFYETVNAGTDWNLVLGTPGGAPNAPALCNIGSDGRYSDILMCTDGRYIWRSVNKARSWTKVSDMTTIPHSLRYYSGVSIPCIAGANGRVYIGHGPFLIRSDDAGLSFIPATFWDRVSSTPPQKVVYDRLGRKIGNQIVDPGFLVNSIIISSIDGPTGSDVVFLVRIEDLYPVEGYTDLFSWTFKTEDSFRSKNYLFRLIFQQHLSPIESGQQLDSFDVAVLGESYNDKLIFSAQTNIIDGKPVPSLKYSLDGGTNWYDVDVSNAMIGDPEEGGVFDISLVDDAFAKNTWVGPGCNNKGDYDYVELYRTQLQSYEVDAMTESSERSIQKTQKLDAILVKRPGVEQNIDAILTRPSKIPYNVDGLFQGVVAASYRVDRTLEGVTAVPELLDGLVEKAIDVPYETDAHLWANLHVHDMVDALLKDKNASIYQIDAIFRRNNLPTKLVFIEKINPQFLDLMAPDIPYAPIDSRRETL